MMIMPETNNFKNNITKWDSCGIKRYGYTYLGA